MSRSSNNLYLPKMRPLPSRRAVIMSVLDVGSTKVCCLIAKLVPQEEKAILSSRSHKVEVLGYGYQRSRGIKSGVVVDMDAAEQAIRLAVDSAERMAGVTVESLIANISCGRLQSEIYSANVPLAGDSVCEADIQRVLSAGSSHSVTDGRAVTHALPISYSLDGSRGIRDPRGMMGHKLGCRHAGRDGGDPAGAQSGTVAYNRGHLHVETMVATPFASGLSPPSSSTKPSLVSPASTWAAARPTLSVFVDGHMVQPGRDCRWRQSRHPPISPALSQPALQDAERLKTLYGSPLASQFRRP